MRLFVALWPPPSLTPSLRQALDIVQAHAPRTAWRPTPPDQCHVTLRFLGEIPEERTPELLSRLSHSTRGVSPFLLAPGPPGCFPSTRNPRVLWLGLTGDVPALARLQTGVVEACRPFAPQPDPLPFHPHLTLARSGPAPELARRTLPDLLRRLGTLPATTPDTATEVRLVESRPGPQGARYTTVAVIPLLTTR